ncbi:MAG TPA: hypothetical protein VNO56_06160 [Gaiellaceae bacterium]|nr:hypothetical protein [Gaiellaceae bacterium]
MTRYRDEGLGAALRALEIPEHAPGFYADLHRRLGQEQAARRADVRRRRIARRGGLRWGVRLVFAAAVAAAIWLVAGLPEDERLPNVVENATAAEIQARVRTAFAGAETLTGELVAQGPSFESAYGWTGTQRWRFALTERGDFRLTGLTLEENITYDAGRGVQRSLNPSASLGGEGPLFAAERTGIAPGPPDPGPIDPILENDYGAFVRALLAADPDDPRVRETTYEGKPAWRLDVRAPVNQIVPEHSGDRFAIWVDQATGIPVRVLEEKNGRPLDELRIEKLVVDEPLPRDTFALRFPGGMEVSRSDEGFRRVALGDVAGAVGYGPLVPARVPEGFDLAEVAVSPGPGLPTGTEAGNPPSTDVVSLSYRRGLDQILVTTRLRHVPGSPDAWSDPLATGEGFVDEPESIRLGRGALSDVEANVLIVPLNVPHLWAQTDDLVVTVSGGVSRSDLLRIAESLAVGP